jgi:hypothetical protein
MKTLSAVVCAMLICAWSPAWSQTGGKIVLGGSADGSECSIVESGAGVIEVHVVVLDVVGLSAIQFAAPKPDCWTDATWMSEDVPVEVFLGNTQDPVGGLAVAFGACLDAPVHVATIYFFTTGTGPQCCSYPVLKATGDLHPEVDGPIVVLCSDPTHVAGIPVDAVINPDPSCPCLSPVSAKETTWGGVKSLYN